MDVNDLRRMQVAVTLLPHFNSLMYWPLVQDCGGIEGFFRESEDALQAILRDRNIREDLFDRTAALRAADSELSSMEKFDIQVCCVENNSYPPLLKECEDAPLVFYYRGILEYAQTEKYLAIVGTRRASTHGKARVRHVLQELCEMGVHATIVSGLAYGIDITAHQASLDYNFKTYAVFGHGLNTIYPAPHKYIADKIVGSGGALISEFPCCTRILPVHFLQRNRIIAGLCHATLIAESAEKGGAMATARNALSYNREVMAIPGRPEDAMSSGCNLLIKQNVAALVENGKDIAQILGIEDRVCPNKQMSLDFFETGDDEAKVLEALSRQGGMNSDELSVSCKISISELTALLLKLELEGKILSLPGNNYIVS